MKKTTSEPTSQEAGIFTPGTPFAAHESEKNEKCRALNYPFQFTNSTKSLLTHRNDKALFSVGLMGVFI